VIGPSQFLTAAHCLYNKRAARFVSAESIHILLGYAKGDYRVHRISSKYTVPSAFDPNVTRAYTEDWAVLYTSEPFPQYIRPLRMASATPSPGGAVKAVGFAREQQYLMTVDHHCQIQEISEDAKLIAHDCVINFGDSGGPLLSGDGKDEGLIVGVNVAVLKNGPQWGVAVSTAGVTEFLASQVVGSNDRGNDKLLAKADTSALTAPAR
jgi:protease YdgD